MNGVDDLGGTHGHGKINPEQNEPLWHADWEKRVFGLFYGAFAEGAFNVDEFRYGIEMMEPAEYLKSSYYEHWLHTLEAALIRKGMITQAELDKKYNELKGTA